VLDGNGNPGAASCLAQRWRPWGSVYITGDDPAAAYTSNDPSQGWDRLVMLNEPADEWGYAVGTRYGKFVNSTYPLLLWEPSDQPEIANYSQQYVDAGVNHPAGMRFAINIDPVQFQAYAAPVSGRAWNLPIAGSNGTGSSPAAATFGCPVGIAAAGPSCALFLHQSPDGGQTRWALWAFHNTSAPPTAVDSGDATPLLPAGAANLSLSGVLSGDGSVAFIAVTWRQPAAGGSAGVAALTLAAPASLALSSTTAAVPAVVPGAIAAAAGALVPLPTATTTTTAERAPASFADLAWVTAQAVSDPMPAGCSVSVGAYALSANGTVGAIQAAQCHSRGTQAATSVSVAAMSGGGAVWTASAWSTGSEEAGRLVYANAMCTVGDCTGAQVPLQAPPPLYVGDSPSIALAPAAGGGPLDAAFAVVSGGGYCANTEARNKEADVGLCDQPPAGNASARNLNYHTGSVAGLLAALAAGPLPTGVAASPCSAVVATGTAGMGARPAVALAVTAAGVEVVAALEGNDGSGGDGGGCGAADTAVGVAMVLGWRATVL
jgi:hypothetical protein